MLYNILEKKMWGWIGKKSTKNTVKYWIWVIKIRAYYTVIFIFTMKTAINAVYKHNFVGKRLSDTTLVREHTALIKKII